LSFTLWKIVAEIGKTGLSISSVHDDTKNAIRIMKVRFRKKNLFFIVSIFFLIKESVLLEIEIYMVNYFNVNYCKFI